MRLKGATALAIAAIAWGIGYPAVANLTQTVPIVTYLVVRFGTAASLLSLVYRHALMAHFRESGINLQERLKALGLHALPGAFLAAAFLSQTWGISLTSPATAAFLSSLTFCFIPLLEEIFGFRKNLQRILLPLALALTGIFLLSDAGDIAFQTGEILLLCSALFYALQIFITGNYLVYRHSVIPLIIQSITLVLILAPFIPNDPTAPILALTGFQMLEFLYLILVSTVTCFLLQFWAQRRVKSRYVGIIYTLEPLSALAVSTWLGMETLTGPKVLGTVLILVSVISAVVFSTHDMRGNRSDERRRWIGGAPGQG